MEETIHNLLESDHAELDHLLEAARAAVAAKDKDKAYQTLDYFWARLAMHIRAEHQRLFPAIRDAENTPVEILEILELLRHDHDFFMRELARAIKAMRLVFYFGNDDETFEIVRDLLEAVAGRLADHNRIEEERIYTLANPEFLPPGEVEPLDRSIRKELDNYPQRFADEAGRP